MYFTIRYPSIQRSVSQPESIVTFSAQQHLIPIYPLSCCLFSVTHCQLHSFVQNFLASPCTFFLPGNTHFLFISGRLSSVIRCACPQQHNSFLSVAVISSFPFIPIMPHRFILGLSNPYTPATFRQKSISLASRLFICLARTCHISDLHINPQAINVVYIWSSQ